MVLGSRLLLPSGFFKMLGRSEFRPNIAAFTPWVGQPSNVWMHRQFARLDDQVKTIITWEYLNQDQFPLPNTDIRLVPDQYHNQLKGWKRIVDAVLTPRTGGERFGGSFNRWMRKQLRECKAEAVLGQFGHYAMIAEVASRPLGIPVFAHFHGFDISTRLNKKRYLRSLQSHWHPFAGMIVVARYQYDFLLEQGVDEESIALIPCGAPVGDIASMVRRVRSSSPPRKKGCVFLFVGRFTEKKDPMSVLKAFQHCHQQHPQARLRMAGFGPLRDECIEWTKTQPSSLADAVEFQGTLTPSGVIEEMARADVLVQHSRTAPNGDKEGWPVVIGEAMAASLPIVSTRHAGIVDQVIEGHNGYLCDEGDWRQMGIDMARLASEKKLQRQMGEASYQRVLMYDANDQIERLRQFINRRVADFRNLQPAAKAA